MTETNGSLYWFKLAGHLNAYKFGYSRKSEPYYRVKSYSGLNKPDNNIILLSILNIPNAKEMEIIILNKLREHPECTFIGRSEFHYCVNQNNILNYLKTIFAEYEIVLNYSLDKQRYKYNPKIFECPHCKKQLSTKRILDDHIYNVCSKPKWQCKICNLELYSQEFLKRHEKNCEGRKCPYCSYITPKKKQLQEHINSGICRIKFTCEICKKTLKSRNYLKTHLVKRHKYSINNAINQINKTYTF